MAFPRLNNLSYWLYVAGTSLAVASLFAPGGGGELGTGAGVGWVLYPPLSTTAEGGYAMDLAIFAVHLSGASSILGAISISMIGLFNIGGSILAGYLGKRYTKKYLLAAIYTGRTIASIAFIATPMTPTTVLIFSAVMGSMWLATVPLTSGLVAHLFGLRYMGTLYGFVFLSHQLGSFLGVWLGGAMYDLTGDYTMVWWIGIGVGAFSALIHLPIRERPVALQPA
jgi:predicted MFS family arabinose efflux permease